MNKQSFIAMLSMIAAVSLSISIRYLSDLLFNTYEK